nr:ATP-dependent RNA helicase HrpA [Gammaproteobacteria bacterium]
MQEWHDIHTQLRMQMHDMGFKESEAEAGYEEIHRAVLSGLLSHIGLRSKERDYLGARNSRFHVFPGSGLFKKQPKWVMAAELVETTKLYARTVANIQPEWIEAAAGHLLHRSYSEPHWQKKRGQVGGYEKVTLFGLTLVARRKINFGPIDPPVAREIFLRSALVDGDFDTRAPFWRHNLELIEAVRDLEAKSRRRDILVDEERIYEFYEKRIPQGLYNTADFEKWLKQVSKQQPKLLYLAEADLLREEAERVSAEQFPDTLDINGMQLPLEYHFDPGQQADGVCLIVPRSVLNQVTEERLQWLVPGLLRERVIGLLRGLPKSLRKSLVPIPDTADACLKGLESSERPLVQVLGERLKQMKGVHIPEDAWSEADLPEHLRMQIRVLDEQGKRLGEGRRLADVKRLAARQPQRQASRALAPAGLEKNGLKQWDVGSLPADVTLEQGGIRLKGYPALVDEGETVSLRVLDSESAARLSHKAGVRRLIMLKLNKDIRYLRKNLPNLERMRLQYAKVPDAPKGMRVAQRRSLEDELVFHVVDQGFLDGQPVVRDEANFTQRLQDNSGQLMIVANRVCAQVADILQRYQQVRKRLAETTQINWISSIGDMRQQLDRLVFKGFLQQTPADKLIELPRYLQGMLMRLDKLKHAAARDQQRSREMAADYAKWQEWDQRCRENHRIDERIEEMRWHFEELRISLFAQELGTAYPVSLKRIEKRWRELGL